MRIALLLTSTYAHRPDLGGHPPAAYDAKAVREKLSQRGFEFKVVDVPVVADLDERAAQVLRDAKAGPDDVVVVYLSAFSHLDDAGELAIEVDHVGDEAPVSRARVPLARLRTALNASGVRGAAVVLDLVYAGDADAADAVEHVGAVRRVFAPELSGYSLLIAVRSTEQAAPDRGGGSAFTSLFLRTLDKPEARNAAGAVPVSRVIDQMREDPDLYTDVPCMALVAGRRDLPLYSIMEALKHAPMSQPPPSRSSSPSGPAPAVGVTGLLAAAEQHFARGEWDAAVEAYKRALLLFGEEKSSRRAEVYVRLADMKVSQGRRREAIIGYRKALSVLPTHTGALRQLADVVGHEGDFQEAVRLRRQLLELTQEPQARFDVLLLLADDCEKARDIKGTTAALEDARALRPEDTVVLARLAQVYDSTHEYLKVVEIKVSIANLKTQTEELARSLVLAADFARERAAAPDRALEIYASALDADPITPRAFDSILELLKERGDVDAIERAMLAQALRLEVNNADAAQAEVWREVAELRRNRRNDTLGAIEALDQCVTLLPTDVEARATLADMLAEVDQIDAAIMCLEIAALGAPGRVETYRRLHQLLAKKGEIDRAYLAAAALVQLEEADLDEQMYFEQYNPIGVVRPTRCIDEQAWQDMYPSNHDVHVRTILHLVASAAIEYKLAHLQQAKLLPPLDPEKRQDPEKSTVSLTRTFVWASKVLNVPLPDIYVADEVPGGIAAVPAMSPTAFVGKSVLSGRSLQELSFLVGRDLTYYRPEHYVLVLFSSLRDLTSLLLAAVKVIRPSLAVPEQQRKEISELATSIKAALDEEALAQLTEAVAQFDEAGGRVDLVGWARTIELAATRAGLLLCGDLSIAAGIMERDERGIAELTAVDRMNDLLPFTVSQAYARLRDMLGISVGVPKAES
ncbi:MAG: tetratricopeptide repeat protein [Deltaproteobacteria bacterium]|nr:tetratricopeptide repeat protein [Deltaproteobacteria bacterium]